MSKKKYLLVIVLFSLLPTIPYFTTSDLIHTHDGLVHLPRLAAYYRALADGDFPVRFAGFLNYGYGLPLFNFIYPFPYWIGSLFLLLGFGLVNSFKISLVLSFIFSGIFMYLFGKEYFEDDKKGLMIAIVYQFAPFRMIELLVRGSYGEVYTYTFLPLILYGLCLLLKKFNFKGFLISSMGTFFLIISHNSVSLLFFAAACMFVIFMTSKRKEMIKAFSALFVGVIMASFYWMPAILEHKYTYGDLFMKDVFSQNFPPFINFFIPNFNNAVNLQTGGITTFIGFVQILAIVSGIIFLTRNKLKKGNSKKIYFYGYFLLIISLFFTMPISSPIWSSEHGNFLRQFQFPWRFLSLIVFSCAILSVSFFHLIKFSNKLFWAVIILTVLSVSLYWKASEGFDKINESYYWNFPLNTTYYGETDVIWSAGPAKSYPKEKVEIISGDGKIENLKKENSLQIFDVLAHGDLQIVSKTTYFPGWSVRIDGDKTPIQFQDPNHRGELVFNVDKGEHKVKIEFEESKIRFFANTLSLLGIIFLVPVFGVLKKYS